LVVGFITALLDQVERAFFDFLIGVTTRERFRLSHSVKKNRHQKLEFHFVLRTNKIISLSAN
jgi:hypothetical protein